jgi:HEPN domain-containing protein
MNVLRALTCPITHELFDDPVVAPDGNTYEREALTKYVRKKHGESRKPMILIGCPLNPGATVGDLKKLPPNRKVLELVELAVKLAPDDELAQEWNSKKRKRELDLAETLFQAGRVAEAAALGHPAAVAALRVKQRALDAAELVKQAKDVVRVNSKDPLYRRLLRQAAALESQDALFMLGTAYAEGQGGDVRPEKALDCFLKSRAVQAVR